jgi:hypothetical protein
VSGVFLPAQRTPDRDLEPNADDVRADMRRGGLLPAIRGCDGLGSKAPHKGGPKEEDTQEIGDKQRHNSALSGALSVVR